MSVDLHDQSLIFSDAAELADRAGDRQRAREYYLQALALEEQVLAGVPSDRPKTRRIFERAVEALRYRADYGIQTEAPDA